MKKNLTIQFFKNGYEEIASADENYLNYQIKRTEAQKETGSQKWRTVSGDFGVYDNGDYRIISGVLYKKIKTDGNNRNLKS